MELYAGIDLHSNNAVLMVLDGADRVVFAKRLANDLEAILMALRSCAGSILGVAVESTYNWYWLVDGCRMRATGCTWSTLRRSSSTTGSSTAATSATRATWPTCCVWASCPTGYIYPREQRAVRDLMRKRSQLVRQRSSQILSMQNLVARNLGAQCSGNDIKRWDDEDIDAMNLLDDQKLALKANLAVMDCLDRQMHTLERRILASTKLSETYPGAQERQRRGRRAGADHRAGDRRHRPVCQPGQVRVLCAHGGFSRESNGKKKGEGNAKCGNKHLAWAFIEAAHFAVRYDAAIKRWYQKKCASSLSVVAIKAVAHKLARACYHVIKSGQPFDATRAFG
jgi:transposase